MTATGIPIPRGATAKPISQDPQEKNEEDKKKATQVKTNSSAIDASLPNKDKKTTAKALTKLPVNKGSPVKKPDLAIGSYTVLNQVPKSAVKLSKKWEILYYRKPLVWCYII